MESTVYINTLTKTAHHGITGHAEPKILARLQAHLQVDVHFFTTGEEAALLESPTFRVALKATPTGASFLFTSTVTEELDDGYRFTFASVDAAALRTYLGDCKEPKEAWLEIEWTLDGAVERVATPALIENAYIRTETSPPIPGEDERNQWFLDRLALLITSGGYFEFQNSDGDWFHIGLNSGQAPE